VALVPAVAALVGQVSLVAPLVNAFAIPLVALVGTPLALMFAALSAISVPDGGLKWVGELAHLPIDWTMQGAAFFSKSPLAVWHVAAAPVGWMVLGVIGVAWGLAPAGLPGRAAAWMLIFPLLAWRPAALLPGAWQLVALDVGQGGSAVILTASHTVVFDTGLRFDNGGDMGARVVVPFLRAMGRHTVDTMVISHQHSDHMGGMRGLLAGMPVMQAYAPFDVNAQLRRDSHAHHGGVLPRGWPLAAQRCAAGFQWVYDDVRFRFVHPPLDHGYSRQQANASSCVLVVEGRYHRAVLPGDIGSREERQIAASVGQVDVGLVAHHGSATSSSETWIEHTSPKLVIAQMGYLNRFNHPSSTVLRRWRAAAVPLWRNDLDGAVDVLSTAQGLQARALRQDGVRYWHCDLHEQSRQMEENERSLQNRISQTDGS